METDSKILLKKVTQKFEEVQDSKQETDNDKKYKKVKPKRIQESNYKINFLILAILTGFGLVLFNVEESNSFILSISVILILINLMAVAIENIRHILIDLAILIFFPLLYCLTFLLIYNKVIPDFIGDFEFTQLFYLQTVLIYYSLISLIGIISKFLYNINLSREDIKVINTRDDELEKNYKLNREYEELFNLSLKNNDVMNELLINTKYKDLVKTKEYSINRRVREIEKEREALKEQKRRLSAFSPQKENELDVEICIENE